MKVVGALFLGAATASSAWADESPAGATPADAKAAANASQPATGESPAASGAAPHGLWESGPPKMSPGLDITPYDPANFRPNPVYDATNYDYQGQLDIYGAKRKVTTQRPLIELGRELYVAGPYQNPSHILGEKNPVYQHLWMFGDYRTAVAYNDNGNAEGGTWQNRLNLDIDYQFTATERIHYFVRPIDRNNEFTGVNFGGDADRDHRHTTGLFDGKIDANPDALFFEGDLGAIWAGVSNTENKFDLPFTAGIIPLLFMNGIWVQDAFSGFSFAIPARNVRSPYISNMDIVFFSGFDKVSTQAVPDDQDAQVFGITSMIETGEGYLELGYGYLNDRGSGENLSYHNLAVSFTRRYGNFISNSVRLIANVGQNPDDGVKQTADGFIVLIENTFSTGQDQQTIVPYLNFFAGFDHPQPLARDAGAGGILLNSGILFETDGLTGFPKMADTGADAIGAALGIEFLFNLDQQLVLEVAGLSPRHPDRGDDSDPNKVNQIGVGLRYQLPITNAIILRFDAMYAAREELQDLSGVRFEVRYKF